MTEAKVKILRKQHISTLKSGLKKLSESTASPKTEI